MAMVDMLDARKLQSEGEVREQVGDGVGRSTSSSASISRKEEAGARGKELGARCPEWRTRRHCIEHVGYVGNLVMGLKLSLKPMSSSTSLI
jgi:hypothetical protein